MKKFSMSIGIVILAMLIGLTMTACQNPAGGGKKARTGPGEVVPAITNVSAATTTFVAAGGNSVITVTGTYLADGIKVTAFDGATATSITGTTSGSGASQTVTLNFPKNESTAADKAYTVKASLDGGTTRVTQTAAVTVSRAVGWIGPAGGLVFYDKGDDTGGWRYLEAAPAGSEPTAMSLGIYSGNDVIGTQTGVGTGKQNTELIIAYLSSKGETDKAAQYCDNLIIDEKDDWFLPSRDELDLMYNNLKKNGWGGFSNNLYWSSSQSEMIIDCAYCQNFSNGSMISNYTMNNPYFVRAIRAF